LQITDFTRRMVAVPDGEVAILDFGDPARPVDILFSHGNGFNAMCHAPALGPLAKELRILAIDQRGHGLTRQPTTIEGRDSWYGLKDDLLVLMEALKLEGPVVLAGHSMGSVVSLLASVDRPKAVRSVVMFDPVVPPRITPPEDFGPGLIQIINGTRRRRRIFASKAEAVAAYTGRGVFATWPRDALEAYVEDGFAAAPGGGVELTCDPGWEASNYEAQKQATRAILLTTQVPTHVLRASAFSPCSVEDNGGNPQLAVETVAGTTHCLPMERPDLVQAALRAAV
jgi:pimeloyl-ACP methyl ester carboxylesterase